MKLNTNSLVVHLLYLNKVKAKVNDANGINIHKNRNNQGHGWTPGQPEKLLSKYTFPVKPDLALPNPKCPILTENVQS